MRLLLDSLQMGLLYAVMAFGIYISFRILSVPDLTTEGSFVFGLAVSAALAARGHSVAALPAAMLAGAAAGAVTGLLQTKMKVNPMIAGIITMSALYSINLAVMGGTSNLTLIGVQTVYKLIPFLTKKQAMTWIPMAAALLSALLLILFFKTHIGMCIRAVGDNEEMVRASSINTDACKILAFMISNAFIALSGALVAQYQGYSDISSGSGMLVVGLASVIIGEAIFGRRGVTLGFLSVLAGAFVYRLLIALATRYSPLPPTMLKLASALIVALALSLPAIKGYIAQAQLKRGGRSDA